MKPCWVGEVGKEKLIKFIYFVLRQLYSNTFSLSVGQFNQ